MADVPQTVDVLMPDGKVYSGEVKDPVPTSTFHRIVVSSYHGVRVEFQIHPDQLRKKSAGPVKY